MTYRRKTRIRPLIIADPVAQALASQVPQGPTIAPRPLSASPEGIVDDWLVVDAPSPAIHWTLKLACWVGYAAYGWLVVWALGKLISDIVGHGGH